VSELDAEPASDPIGSVQVPVEIIKQEAGGGSSSSDIDFVYDVATGLDATVVAPTPLGTEEGTPHLRGVQVTVVLPALHSAGAIHLPCQVGRVDLSAGEPGTVSAAVAYRSLGHHVVDRHATSNTVPTSLASSTTGSRHSAVTSWRRARKRRR
jgi:hypothetical protein